MLFLPIKNFRNRSTYQFTVFTNSRKEINNLLIQCKYFLNGCKLNVKFADLIEHQNTCNYKGLRCYNGCELYFNNLTSFNNHNCGEELKKDINNLQKQVEEINKNQEMTSRELVLKEIQDKISDRQSQLKKVSAILPNQSIEEKLQFCSNVQFVFEIITLVVELIFVK